MVRLGDQGLPEALQNERLAQASLVRIYATVRHFARWLQRKFPDLFPLGCPTDGVKPPAEPTADWKGLTRLEEMRLLSAAQTLRVRPAPAPIRACATMPCSPCCSARACASPRS